MQSETHVINSKKKNVYNLVNGVFTLPETDTDTEKMGTVPNGICLGLGLGPV